MQEARVWRPRDGRRLGRGGTMGASQQYDRERLYDEVWSTPMSRLCKSYGVTDTGLKKACLRLNVPLPGRGHWAKVAAGKSFAKPALPPANDARAAPPPRKALGAAVSISGSPTPIVISEPDLSQIGRWHPALSEVRAALTEAVEWAMELKRLHENPPKRDRNKPQMVFHTWKRFCDGGQILWRTHQKRAVRVSLLTYRRALVLMNKVAFGAEGRGYAVKWPENAERLELHKAGAFVGLKVAEVLLVGSRIDTSSWRAEPQPIRTSSPTGRLRLRIEQQGLGETLLADRDECRIEDDIDKVLEAIDARHALSLKTVQAWRDSAERSAKAEAARKERERLEEEARKERQREQERVDALLQEAGNWVMAHRLRMYIAELDARVLDGDLPRDGGFTEWRTWALAVANNLDPSNRRFCRLRSASDAAGTKRGT